MNYIIVKEDEFSNNYEFAHNRKYNRNVYSKFTIIGYYVFGAIPLKETYEASFRVKRVLK